ncbi:MAG: hypothetical protein WCY08_06650 [Rhodocyclaceae bacterium]
MRDLNISQQPSTSQVWVACRGRWSLSGIVIGGRVCQVRQIGL